MQIPKSLRIITWSFLILGGLGFGYEIISGSKEGDTQFLSNLTNLAIIITLIVLIYYVYYTYLIAKEAWTPCASFFLSADGPSDISTELINHSKIGLRCWCKINPKIAGKKVKLGGYYGGKCLKHLQPLASSTKSSFRIQEDILDKAEARETMSDMKEKTRDRKQKTNDTNKEEQLTFDVEFWYKTINGDERYDSPPQKYHYDFTHGTVILDG